MFKKYAWFSGELVENARTSYGTVLKLYPRNKIAQLDLVQNTRTNTRYGTVLKLYVTRDKIAQLR